MQFLFSRRTYNASEKKFKWGVSSKMRYVAVPEGTVATREHFQPFEDNVEGWLTQIDAAAAGRPVIVFVHGFNTEQKDARRRMSLIQEGLEAAGLSCLVVLFDWPSDGTIPGYPLDRIDARKTAASFVADGIMQLRRVIPRERLHLVAHSMGAYLTLKAFGAIRNFDERLAINEGIFVAADVEQAQLANGADGQRAASRWFERFTNYYSSLDQVLNIQKEIVSGKVRLGYDGCPADTDPDYDDVYCGGQYTAKVPDNEKGQVPSHTFYWSDPGFYQDMALTLNGRPRMPRPTRRGLQSRPGDVALLT